MLRSAGLDDLLMIVALTFAIFLSIACLVGESFGLGKHIWNLSSNLADIPGDTGKVTKALYGAYLAYSTSITFTKFSIMATYTRIFPAGWLRNVVYGTGIVILCFWIASIFAIIFTCVPVQAAWDYNIKGRCFPIVNFFYTSSAFNIFTDLLLVGLPIPTLWALDMPKPQRTVLICLFGLGSFACVASILRLTHLNLLSGDVDVTYQTVNSLNWSVVEVDTGIVCAAISSLRPLAKCFIPKLIPLSSRSPSPTEKPIVSTTTQTTNSFTSQFLPPPAKILSFNAMMSPAPNASTTPARSGSIVSSKSEIYVQKTFEVQTMKDLPALPDFSQAVRRAQSRAEAEYVEGVVEVKPPTSLSLKGIEKETELIEIQIPQRMSSIEKGKGKAKEIVQTESHAETKMQWTETAWTETPKLKWPKRALTKGKHERDASRSRPSVVGMFTADLLDFTSSEDEGLVMDEGRESTESEAAIRQGVLGKSSSSE